MSTSALTQHLPMYRLQLTQARMARQWSQSDVAQMLGTTQANVSRWERGITRPSTYFRERLCAIFNKTAHDLGLDVASESFKSSFLVDPALPPASSLVVGREAELERLKQLIQQRVDASPVVLSGLPGVGKTTLALTLAHDPLLEARFPDGVLWAGLGPYAELSEVLARWGMLLGVSDLNTTGEQVEELWVQRLREILLSRSMLLVIDDVWSLKVASLLLIGGPKCMYLVTTRLPLLAAQLTVENSIPLQELTTQQSVELLRKLAPKVVQLEETRTMELVRELGGLPLAIKLAGSYLRTQSYSGQTRRIRAALTSLSDGEKRVQLTMLSTDEEYAFRTFPRSTLSLQSIIAVTDHQLDSSARKALYSLSVFPAKPHTFSEEAALAIASCSADALDALSDAGLLESTTPGRYSLHQTICDYARLHLDDASTWQRFISYGVGFVEEHICDYQALERESSIIQAALHVAQQEGKNEELVRGVCSFTPYLILRDNYHLAQQLADVAYKVAIELRERDAIVVLLSYKGELAIKRGEIASAEPILRYGLALARQLNDPKHLCLLLKNYGLLLSKIGDYGQAESLLQEGVALARQHDLQEFLIELLLILGSIMSGEGKYSRAIAYFERGLLLARSKGGPDKICSLLFELGLNTVLVGDSTGGETLLNEALEVAQRFGNRELIAVILLGLGVAAIIARRFEEARSSLEEGLQLARQVGSQEWIALLLLQFAEASNSEGNVLEAERRLHECQPLAQALHNPRITCMYFCARGNLALLRGDTEAAETAFCQMMLDKPAGNQALLAQAHYGLARVANARGDLQLAREQGTTSLELFESIHYHLAPVVKTWLDSLDAE